MDNNKKQELQAELNALYSKLESLKRPDNIKDFEAFNNYRLEFDKVQAELQAIQTQLVILQQLDMLAKE